eukprot:6209720-Pleurochrysis_carterae.AAC.1
MTYEAGIAAAPSGPSGLAAACSGWSPEHQPMGWHVQRVFTGIYMHLKAFPMTSTCLLSLVWVLRQAY